MDSKVLPLRPAPQSNSGVTLIELLVTISIAAILLAMAAPSYNSFVLGQRVRNASFEVFSMLTLARSEAIKRNAKITVDAESGGWKDGWTMKLKDDSSVVLDRSTGFSNITIHSTSTSLTFTSNGRLDGAVMPSFQVAAGSDSRCIKVDLSGMPRSSKGNCT